MRFSLFIFLVLFSSQVFSQTRTIRGIVTDEHNVPLIGANISCKGTSKGTITDIEGNYSIEVANEQVTLIYAYTGYTTIEKIVKKNENNINIIMDARVSLDEVIVTGYSTKRYKSSKGRAASSVRMSRPRPKATYESMPSRSSSTSGYRNSIRSGTLTAGEIHDFSKWQLWEDIAADKLEQWQTHWQINPKERYSVQLTTSNNSAVIDAEVRLIDKDGTIVWETRSDNTGKAELWANLFKTETNKTAFSIEATYEGETYTIKKANEFHNGINTLQIPIPCYNNKLIDVAFVVDATGSMSDEIEYLKIELNDIINTIKDTLPDLSVRLGTVFYRDEGEAYLTKKSVFDENIEKTTDFIQQQSAGGGGDFPEAVEEALHTAIDSLEWSEIALGRFLFLVLDAPPHHTPEILSKLQQLAQKAAAKGIRIIPITGSGIDKSTEYLMRTLALMTNGTYVFLTDHSGVGGAHIKPTTDSYDVELLNDLLVRLIYQYTYVPDCEEEDLADLDAPSQVVKSKDKDKILSKISWKYFPNPTSGEVNVKLKGTLDYLFLTDFSGKILQRHSIKKATNLRLDLSDFPSGVYFLKAINGKQSLDGKLILTRP